MNRTHASLLAVINTHFVHMDAVGCAYSYTGLDTNNIWAAGSAFGELEWATGIKDRTMDPDAKDFSPW
jgi:hypothetical protein